MSQEPLFRRFMDRQLSEAQWQKQVEEALDAFGWTWWHIPSNVVVCPNCHAKVYRGIRKGFPDLLAIRSPVILWIELKRERGQLSPDQRQMFQLLRASGQTVLHARPRDREWLFELLARKEVTAPTTSA